MEKTVSVAELFDSILDAYPESDHISVQQIMDHLGQRAYGPLFLLFAAPNVIPNIPGSGVISAPLMPLAFQMAKGNRPWLPRKVANKLIARSFLMKTRDKTMPLLKKVRRFAYPRLPFFTSLWFERLLGMFLLPLTFVLFLPIPLGNMMPAWSVAAIGVGVLERDGVWVLGGVLLGVLAMLVAGLVVFAGASVVLGAVA